VALAKFEKHIESFLLCREHRHLREWQNEKVLFTPEFSNAERKYLIERGYVCRDLHDYSKLV